MEYLIAGDDELEHEHKHCTYSALLISCKLDSYLRDIDRQTEAMFSQIVQQMAARDGVTEKLKAENQILWVQRMNSARQQATEIVHHDLIYA